MSLQKAFAAEIEAFLTEHRMDATTFGREALKDPSFVFEVRKGRSPRLAVADRVRAFMNKKRRSLARSRMVQA